MMTFNLNVNTNNPISNTNYNNTNLPHSFSWGSSRNRPKLLYIDIIGNTKPGGCKRCGGK